MKRNNLQTLTYGEARECEREMWKWIAQTTRKTKTCVGQEQYFRFLHTPVSQIPVGKSYVCMIASRRAGAISNESIPVGEDCKYCPLSTNCTAKESYYLKWWDMRVAGNYKAAAVYADLLADEPWDNIPRDIKSEVLKTVKAYAEDVIFSFGARYVTLAQSKALIEAQELFADAITDMIVKSYKKEEN